MATRLAWTKYAFWILHRSTHALKKACLSVRPFQLHDVEKQCEWTDFLRA